MPRQPETGSAAFDRLLEIRGLNVEIMTARGIVYAVRGADLEVRRGSIHGLVGESGCGKSVTAKSILRLHDEQKVRMNGEILFQGRNILTLSRRDLRQMRGTEISMIFQDPMISLNPLYTIGEQISEIFRCHKALSHGEAKKRSIEILEKVGIHPAEKRFDQYPFEFSGGMLQRVMIAIAIACEPKLLIADEPTTALDVTIQVQILDLLKELQRDLNLSVLLITHNFGIVAEVCDTVSVMYAGKILETGDVKEVLSHTANPYSQALIRSIPRSGSVRAQEHLPTISGSPPQLFEKIPGCPFAPRCGFVKDICRTDFPSLDRIGDGKASTGGNSAVHFAACHRLAEGGLGND